MILRRGKRSVYVRVVNRKFQILLRGRCLKVPFKVGKGDKEPRCKVELKLLRFYNVPHKSGFKESLKRDFEYVHTKSGGRSERRSR